MAEKSEELDVPLFVNQWKEDNRAIGRQSFTRGGSYGEG